MKYLVFFLIVVRAGLHPVQGQSYEKLSSIRTGPLTVFASKGHEKVAKDISARVGKAMDYYQDLLDAHAEVILLVLTEADWPSFTAFPVYGMPHYNDNKTLVVATGDNAFWNSFIPPPEALSPELKKQLQSVYGRADGTLSMEPFFNLLALHELGHAFHFQAGLAMQRKWMGELFVNILLHTYIAEMEPGRLAALTLFPQMVIGAGTTGYSFTSLKDVHDRYDEIGQRHPKNYGWYQSRWHAGAGTIYDAAGKKIGRTLWDAFRNQPTVLGDAAFTEYLDKQGASSVADFIRNWDRDTRK